MGFININKVSIHKSIKGNIMLKYVFTNKNSEKDYMYIPIPKGYTLQKVKSINNFF